VSEPETKYKCTENVDGSWYCEKSGKTLDADGPGAPMRRWILPVNFIDHTATQAYCTAFDDVACAIIGKTADEMYQLGQSGDDAAMKAAYASSKMKQFWVKLKLKSETYNEESRVKTTLLDCVPVTHAEESKRLLKLIAAY